MAASVPGSAITPKWFAPTVTTSAPETSAANRTASPGATIEPPLSPSVTEARISSAGPRSFGHSAS